MTKLLNPTLAFDVYGTLIDVIGVTDALRPHCGDQASQFARTWREVQLGNTWKRALGRNYAPFDVVTRQALDMTCSRMSTNISAPGREALLALYTSLPCYPDVPEGLAKLKAGGARLFAFSNGRSDDIPKLLGNAGILNHFEACVTLQAIQTYKPDPAAYAYFARQSNAAAHGPLWLVSSNGFDVVGAASNGWRTAWVQRDASNIMEPWGIDPTLTVRSLSELATALLDS